MNKKTCDYKVNLNFQFSSHGLKIRPTDSEIKKTALDLLSEYLKETKNLNKKGKVMGCTSCKKKKSKSLKIWDIKYIKGFLRFLIKNIF